MKNCPIITISRQYGSGGSEIGESLAKRLQISYYDKKLISLAAQKSGISEKAFLNADEQASNSFLYSLMMGTYAVGNQPSSLDMPINDRLFLLQSNLIKKAADDGPCVIVGRCADYILHERKNCFHVFIHANKEYRIKRAIEKYGIDSHKASDYVRKKDKQRANYYDFYTNQKWDSLENYHLVLDSSVFSTDAAVDLIIRAAEIFSENGTQNA